MTVKEFMEHWDTYPSTIDVYKDDNPYESIDTYDFWNGREGVWTLRDRFVKFLDKYGDKEIFDYKIENDCLKLYFEREEIE